MSKQCNMVSFIQKSRSSGIFQISILVSLKQIEYVPLIYISVFVPVPYCLDYWSSEYSLKAGRLITPVPFFFLKIALAIQGFLYFHTNCEIIRSSSLKITIGSLIGIALNLQISLSSILIFTILILPTHEHGIFLHLFVSSLISFINVLQFSMYRSFFFS